MFGGRDVLWLGVGCLMIGCGGLPFSGFGLEGGGRRMHGSLACTGSRATKLIWGVPLIQPWCARPSWGLCSDTVISFLVSGMATSIHQNHITQNLQHLHTMHKISPHVYKNIPWIQ